MSSNRSPVLLVIRDGWGKNPHPSQDQFNATVPIGTTPRQFYRVVVTNQ